MTSEVIPVAVVGGGIAGAAACLRLCQAGCSPLWIAPRTEPGDKPGEHLAAAARPLLETLGVADLLDAPCHRHANTMLSAWGSARLGRRDAIVHLEGPPMVLDRPAFERDLVARALAAGARRFEVRLDSAAWEIGSWRLNDAALPDARFLIDASGHGAVVADEHAQRFRADRLAALHCFLDRDPANPVSPTRATLIEAVEEGWWYAALLADGRLALNYYSDPDLLPRDVTRDPAVFRQLLGSTQHVARWVAEAGFCLVAPPSLASAGTVWIAPAAGAHWAAIGDAAAAFDPLSSHGMTTALWTAIAAADAALTGQEAPLAHYAARVAAGVQEFLVSRAEIYRQEPRFIDRTFWRRRGRLEDATATGYE